MRQKVIGIGFHKTGTTSLGQALEILGYSNFHGAGTVRGKLGNQTMMEFLKKGNLEPILKIAEEADAMEDNPWFSIYPELDKKFPNSKFILTIRDDHKWLASAKRYFKGESDFRKWIYGVGNPEGNESLFLERYRAHNQEVRQYFKDRPEDLIVLDWENGDSWPEICTFLNKPIPSTPFPHLNKTQKSRFKRVKSFIKKIMG